MNDIKPRGEAFRLFDAITGQQIYPTIIDVGLIALSERINRFTVSEEARAHPYPVDAALAEVAAWLREGLIDHE